MGIKHTKSSVSGQNSRELTIVLSSLISININYVPHRRGGGHIVFGADPVGIGVSVASQ